MAIRDIVVVGGSAGGIEALQGLVRQLPDRFPAAILAVLHTAPLFPSSLAPIIGSVTPLKTCLASNGQLLKPGHIYIAPPDHHMVLDDGHVILNRGPRENNSRPAIDPLLRSAAVAGGPRTIGIVLTGLLDDGAAGLRAIKRCGGLTLVQDPEDAAFPDMPRSAIAAATPDYILPVADMAGLLSQLTREEINARFIAPPDLAKEFTMSVDNKPDSRRLEEWGDLVPINCPECGGPIWEHRDGELHRYRCLVGHAFTGQALLTQQTEKVETTLWAALLALEEQSRTLARLAEDEDRSGSLWMAFAERAAETREKAQTLRSMLTRVEQPAEATEND